jgi:hypothetical protein
MSDHYTPEPPLIWDIEEIEWVHYEADGISCWVDVEAFEELEELLLEELLKEQNDDGIY